jgi:hypothetical protein
MAGCDQLMNLPMRLHVDRRAQPPYYKWHASIKITGYQKNGKSKRLFQLFGEPVKFGCADRVQPGGWFT